MIAHVGKGRNRRSGERPENRPERIELKEWLRDHRRGLGLGPIDVSTATGFLSVNHYLQTELGAFRFDPSVYQRLAAILQVDTGYLSRRLLRAYYPEIFAACFDDDDLAPDRMLPTDRSRPEPQQPCNSDALRAAMGKRLADLRKDRGKSQGEVAAAIGFSNYNAISAYERAAASVPPERFVAYADALGRDRCPFIKEMMAHYEPVMHHHLFEA